MRSKFGQGSSVGMLVPISAATSSFVMVTSILIGLEPSMDGFGTLHN